MISWIWKKTLFFSVMDEQLLGRLTKLIEQIWGNVLTYTMKHKETSAFDRKLTSSGAKKVDNSKRKRKQKRRQTRRIWCKKKNLFLLLFKKKECIRTFYDVIKVTKTKRIFEWADRGERWTQNKQDLRTVCRPLLFVQPTHYGFVAKRIARLPK